MGIVSLYSANYSEESWGDPMVFRPERFLDEKTNTLDPVAVSKVMAFGLGMNSSFYFCPENCIPIMTFFLYVFIPKSFKY